MRWLILPFIIVLAGCAVDVNAPASPPTSERAPVHATAQSYQPTRADQERFVRVVERMKPVAERECRNRGLQRNCNFKIVVDDRPNQPPNAFQTLDRDGRPILGFNLALIASVRNDDELAFVVGHEAGHHIAAHLQRQQQHASAGAFILGGLAAMSGASDVGIRTATDLGAAVGARSYSKDFELEADALGTILSLRAGFDPVRGAEFFNQIPDPGDRFLGTHPPHAVRIETIRRVAAQH